MFITLNPSFSNYRIITKKKKKTHSFLIPLGRSQLYYRLDAEPQDKTT